MHDCRADEAIAGEPVKAAAAMDSVAENETPGGERHGSHEGDVIRGLRSGLVFSLAIWAMLFTVGALFFA